MKIRVLQGRMMAKVMPWLLMMALIHHVLAMLNRPHERMLKLCKMLPKVKVRNLVLMPRAKLTRCEESQRV
jgi:predicted site-specific integrase-resolvase